MERPALQILSILCALAFFPSHSTAQVRCFGAVEELSAQSARTRLGALSAATNPHQDVMADAVTCSTDTIAPRRRALIRRRDTLYAAAGWPTLRANALAGLADPREAGSMWSGRGTSFYGTAAIALDAGVMHALVAPALWWAENESYEFHPTRDTTRSGFASWLYDGQYSLDLPSRQGATPLGAIELGNSALWASLRSIDVGLSASPQAWGPGLRAHLFLGPDAPGIPRAFVRTPRPLHTRLGAVSLSGFMGRLTESRFFDADATNDERSLWAWTAAITPSVLEDFTFGITHGIMRPDGFYKGRADQMMTLYARGGSDAEGFRGWAEVGRMGALPSLRQFLTVPYAGIGYVLGLEYAQPRHTGTLLASAEAVNVEQPTDVRENPPRDFYTSADIPQGWTQRGRLLGVATGPGSQSQWIGVDWVAQRWSAGVFGERVRWNEDAFLREYLPYSNRHDVTLRMGTRFGFVVGAYETTLQLSLGKRLNYLFQNGSYIPGLRTVDVSVPQLRFAITPRPTGT